VEFINKNVTKSIMTMALAVSEQNCYQNANGWLLLY